MKDEAYEQRRAEHGNGIVINPQYPLNIDVAHLKLVPTCHRGSKPPRTRYGQPVADYAVYYGDAYLGNLGLYKDSEQPNALRMIFEVHDPYEDIDFYAKNMIKRGLLPRPVYEHKKASLRIG